MLPLTTWTFRQSEIKAFKNCPRSWYLGYKKDGSGYEFKKSDEPESGQRDVGTLCHLGVEAHYNGLYPVGAIQAAQAVHLAEQDGVPLSKEWLEVYKLSTIMVEGYVQWLATEGHDVGEKTAHVEAQVAVPIGTFRGDDVILTGRIDRIVQDTLSGEFIIEDTKTVQSLDQMGEQLQVDDQGLIYAILVRAGLGLDARRFRHNMLRKVKRTANAKPPFYGRHEVRFTEQQLDNAWTHTAVVLDRMVEALQRLTADEEANQHLVAYPNPTRDCTWRCDFLHACSMTDEGADWRGYLTESGIYVPREGNQ